MYAGHGMWFVTARAFQRRLLLRPSAEVNDVVGGVLARAARLTGVRVYAFVFASNHVHILAHAPDGSLSRFMQYLLGNIARKVGRLCGWQGTFWQRRFAAEPVLDDAAAEGRLRYIVSHGVKEGLVRSAREWPGLSCLQQLVGAAERSFRFFNWTRRTRSLRASGSADLLADEWAEPETLKLEPLPSWAGLSDRERRHRADLMVAGIDAEWAPQRTSVPGPAAVLAADPLSTPAAEKVPRKTRPLCHTSEPSLRSAFLEQLRAFVTEFRNASRAFRAGNWAVVFPPMAYRPPALGP